MKAGAFRVQPCTMPLVSGGHTREGRHERSGSAGVAGAAATRKKRAPRNASSATAKPCGQWDPKNHRPELWIPYNGRRTGDATCTGAVESSASTVEDIILGWLRAAALLPVAL